MMHVTDWVPTLASAVGGDFRGRLVLMPSREVSLACGHLKIVTRRAFSIIGQQLATGRCRPPNHCSCRAHLRRNRRCSGSMWSRFPQCNESSAGDDVPKGIFPWPYARCNSQIWGAFSAKLAWTISAPAFSYISCTLNREFVAHPDNRVCVLDSAGPLDGIDHWSHLTSLTSSKAEGPRTELLYNWDPYELSSNYGL